MEKRITATHAVRDFSHILNTIKFNKVRYIIERGGKPVASMHPIAEKNQSHDVGRFEGSASKTAKAGRRTGGFCIRS